MLLYNETPVFPVHNEFLEKNKISLYLKREDLNHSGVSGNKWWKLKYNLAETIRLNKKTMLTFGGAFSNHIYATAAACHEMGLKSIGLIRGEEVLPLNATLKFASDKGMQLDFISREKYRHKHDVSFLEYLQEKYGDHYLIPEGGTNSLALKGCAEFAKDHLAKLDFDYLVLPVGTGGTMAGLISGFQGTKKITGIPVLKNSDFLHQDISALVKNFTGNVYGNWTLMTSYHHGGYARITNELSAFIVMMRTVHNLPFDPVYTGKMMWAIIEEIKKGTFERGSKILAIHTGGLQGVNSILKET